MTKMTEKLALSCDAFELIAFVYNNGKKNHDIVIFHNTNNAKYRNIITIADRFETIMKSMLLLTNFENFFVHPCNHMDNQKDFLVKPLYSQSSWLI